MTGIRVTLVALGVFFAVPFYATALSLNGNFVGRWRFLRALLGALLFTVVAAIGVVGWAR